MRKGQDLFPVYAYDTLLGILDTRRLNEALTWHRLRQKTRRELARPAAEKPSGE